MFNLTITSLIILLVSNSLTLRRDKTILYSRVAILIFIYSLILTIVSYYLTFLGTGIGLYGGLFYISSITHNFHLVIYLLTISILVLTGFYPRKVYVNELSSLKELSLYKLKYNNTGILNKMSEMYKILEYPLIILFIVNGALFLISASDLVSIFIAIELQSYGLYLLCTLYKNSEQSTSGGLMYFLLGGLSSCFILLGTGLLYANSGTTNLDNIYVINNISSLVDTAGTAENYLTTSIYDSYYIIISLIIMGVGFLFKVSAAPFHFWSPDVYDAIPTVVTTFVAIIAKISIFIFLLELVHYLSKSSFNYIWTNNLLISSLLSLVIGTVLGLSQSRIKRLYAYSTISHLGFILLGLTIHSVESIQAFIFYLIQYSFSNLNAFILLITIGYTYYNYIPQKEEKDNSNNNYYNLVDKNNSPIQLISQLKGYFNINPILALSLAITLYSFAGIPPLVGFFGKMMILSAAIDNGYIFMSLVAILTSVIGAVYYLFIIKQIYFEQGIFNLTTKLKNIDFIGVITKNKDIKTNNLVEQSSINNNNNNTNLVSNSISSNLSNTELKTNNFVNIKFNYNNVVISNYLTIIISILTLLILLFIFIPSELLNISCILVLILFKV